MSKENLFIIFFFLFSFLPEGKTNRYFNLFSPDLNSQLNVQINNNGEVFYSYYVDKKPIISKGRLGIKLQGLNSLENGFDIQSIDTVSIDSIWIPVWGEERNISHTSRNMVLKLRQTAENRFIEIHFQLFNNGLGFRYVFPKQSGLGHFVILDELSSFPMNDNHLCFWMPGDYDSNEYTYQTTALSKINASMGKQENGIGFKTWVSDTTIQTPVTMKTKDGYYIAIHEAALINYPAMQLDVDKKQNEFKVHLVPDCQSNKAYLSAGDQSPWRVILVERDAKSLLTNRIILNLNEAHQLKNTEWIKPGKFIGIWWQMHIGIRDWAFRSGSDRLETNKPHGANTDEVIRYINFAAEHRFPYVLVEGWNKGWDDWQGAWKDKVFNFTEPYPDFNLKKIHDHAKAKGVKLIMHHETSSAVIDYERQLQDALDFMDPYEYAGIKSGYVGRIVPRGEHHDGQWMVNHYNYIAQKASERKYFIDVHEPVRPTGLHRTFPNWMSSEAGRGNEFNAWSSGNPPEHETILAFTRLLGGPMDYTPGIFQTELNYYDSTKKERVHTTLSKQLALYVCLYSPLQMAADLLENYEKKMDAFQFIKEVPCDWDSTVVIDAEPGDYIYTARKEKGKGHWYFGAITDENPRDVILPLPFLEKGKSYIATIYRDGDKAHWKTNPMDYKIERKKVNHKDQLKFRLAAGGGCAISFQLISP